nr:13626_t:CDS:1 [Entrophospora candida]
MGNEINILFLGETGVGKSTFINAFANYLNYDNLTDAQSGNMEVLITSKFTMMDDENYETRTIKIGDDDPNEQANNEGASATQGCKSYLFPVGTNKFVRLIDTPGIGDTRGIDKDRENFDNILKYISHYKYLNGICIFLKPNSARLNVFFIQELLSYLHKNAKDNIAFCFTNARSTFYRPGDTLPALRKQLQDLEEKSGVGIKTNKDTMYCFDNESFRFLAALRNGMKFSETDKQSFAESWKRSVDELQRLFEYFRSREPHKVEDTLSLNDARNIMLLLCKPLRYIRIQIQNCVSIIRDEQSKIENSCRSINDLEKNKYIKQIKLIPEQLEFPRVVCTNATCVKVYNVGSVNMTDYTSHCLDRFYLHGIQTEVTNNPYLARCSAMNQNGNCKRCFCHWNKHMAITYENRMEITKVVDKNIEKQIKEKKSYQKVKQAIINTKKNLINSLEEEQKKITSISAKFAHFLKHSAIAAFNDTYVDHLDHLIQEQKIIKDADNGDYNKQTLEELEKSKKEYLENMKVLKEAMKKNNDSLMSIISPEEIYQYEQELYNLPINGPMLLKEIKKVVDRGQDTSFRHEERRFIPLPIIDSTLKEINEAAELNKNTSSRYEEKRHMPDLRKKLSEIFYTILFFISMVLIYKFVQVAQKCYNL